MKHVQFTLIITGEIPDDIDPASLFLDLELSQVRVGHFIKGDPVTIGAAVLHEYETVHAEHLEC